jgi:hypothetical protein
VPIRQPIASGVAVLGLYGCGYLGIAHLVGLKEARSLLRRLVRRR